MPAGNWSRHLPDGFDFDPAQLGRGDNLTAPWAQRWGRQPGADVLRMVADNGGPDGGGGWWSAARLDEATRSAAGRLVALGVSPGHRVVWSTTTSAASIVAGLAVLRLGAVLVPANAAYTEREVGHIVADVRPRLAIVERDEQAGWVDTASGSSAGVVGPDLVAWGGADRRSPGAGSAGSLDRGGTLDSAGRHDPALIVYTSGTTGRPKGAVLSHANLLAATESLALAWQWTPEDRLVLALPLFHVHGLCAGLFGSLAAGAPVVVLPRFGAGEVLDAAADHRGTMFFGVPTMYHRLLASGRVSELARLRLSVSGSAALAPSLWEEIRAESGVAVLERYGMTETQLTVSNPLRGERRPGTVGFPLPGVEIRIDPQEGDGGPGEGEGEGQLLVRGPTVFSGYWERKAADEAAFVDGWFRTGDVVAEDADGYLAIRGRRTDLIISGGYNVYPAEVEEVLLGHPGVAEVAVTGTPSTEWGQQVTAWVVAAGPPPGVEELLAYAAPLLADYKRPRAVRFVGTLPRNALGKVLRGELR